MQCCLYVRNMWCLKDLAWPMSSSLNRLSLHASCTCGFLCALKAFWNPVYPKYTSPWKQHYVSSLCLQIFRVWNKVCSWSSLFMPRCFLLHLLRFIVLLLLWVSEVTVELISFSFFPHQTSPGCTLSIPADSGGRGTNSHRSDHSDPVGDTFIWCPSLVPSGALRVALSIHDSRRHLVVHPKRILVLTHGWVNLDETNGWFKLI